MTHERTQYLSLCCEAPAEKGKPDLNAGTWDEDEGCEVYPGQCSGCMEGAAFRAVQIDDRSPREVAEDRGDEEYHRLVNEGEWRPRNMAY